VLNVNVVEAETDLTESCDKTPYPSKSSLSAPNLVSSIHSLALFRKSVLELMSLGTLRALFTATAQLDNVDSHAEPRACFH
jgi:hypothetical protein